jgi:hypothetical protein
MPQPRRTHCRECGGDLFDSRWWPLCPVCYESLLQEQRRDHIRPPEFDESARGDPTLLEADFESALGGELP